MANFNGAYVGAKSDKGPARPSNQDAFWVSGPDTPTQFGALYLVADGVGGQVKGAEAAQQAVEVISGAFYEARQGEKSITDALDYAINLANMKIYERAQELGVGRMGCTIVSAVQYEGQLFVAHVGDARAYLLMGNRLRRLTRDDTWVQKQIEAGIITAEQAEKHELRNVVTQVLGNKPEINVHMAVPQDLAPGDAFLLSSDGLHGVLSNEQLFLLVRDNEPQVAAEALVHAAIQAETRDNVTAVVVRNGPAPSQANPTQIELPKRKRRGIRLPLWAAGGLILLIGLLIIYSIFRLVTSSGTIAIDLGSGSDATTEVATPDTSVATPILSAAASSTPDVVQPASPEVAPSSTASLPPVTATIAQASETAETQVEVSPVISVTVAATATPELLGCVLGIGEIFVWQDEQVRSNTCNHFAQWSLIPGEQVLILDMNAISVAGPDSLCNRGNFIKVRSVADPVIEGWVTADRVLPNPFGGSCQP